MKWFCLTLVVGAFACKNELADFRSYQLSYLDLFCQAKARCCGDSGPECPVDESAFDFDRITAGIDDGRYSFDAAEAQRCFTVARQKLSRCDNAFEAVDRELGDCEVLRGQKNVGEPCIDFDCVENAYCGLDGVCQLRSTIGMSCGESECARGLVCLPDLTCNLPQKRDELCEVDSQCASLQCRNGECVLPLAETVHDIFCR